jgi:outer membrane receptor protein involved in Fe transport
MFRVNFDRLFGPITLALLFLACAGTMMAQEGSATLRGTVTDPNGSVLPAATVSVANQETGLNRRTATTNAEGDYVFASLTPGLYRISVEVTGFKRAIKENVKLNVGETQEFNFTMEIGGSKEEVTVTADEPLVQTSASVIGGHISQKELIELPSINRNFIGFVGLVPGIVPNISTESFGSDAVSVNGQDPRYNNYLLDSANNNDDVIGQRAGSQARVALEAVQEFQVQTNQFDAEFGRTSGGIINAVTKSGTNGFHGSAFGFFQDNSWNADNRFTVLNNGTSPDTSYKQFGGTIGGPIKKDLAHFFFSYERTNIDQGVIVDIPARPALNAATSTATRANNYLVRGDVQPSQDHQVSIRYLREESPQLNQIIPVVAGGVSLPVSLAASREEADVDQTVVGSWTYSLKSNVVNDLRLSWTQEDVAFANPGFNSGKSMVELPPTLQYNTFVDQQSNVAQARINDSYRLADTLTWIKGSHTFKFGVDYNYVTADNLTEDNLNGTFIFPRDLPFNAADARTYPERLQIRVGGPQRFLLINHNPSVFAQDAWRITPKLTLNLGIRYDDETISDDNFNFSPRLGFAYDIFGDAKTVIRGGYGTFYQNTPFELITAFNTAGPFSTSFVRNFPLNSADPGPRAGNFPTDPTLVNGPVVNHAVIDAIVGTGTLLPNAAPVVDNTTRKMPYTRSFSIGFQRELFADMALTADYIHSDGIDQFLTVSLNPGRRASTSSTAAISRQFATLGAVIQNSFVPVVTDTFANTPFQTLAVANVTTRINDGETHYDALQLSLDKRFSKNFQFKTSYTFGFSRGNTTGNGVPNAQFQSQTDLNLEQNSGPTAFDRRHNFVVSGLYQVPYTRGLIVSTIIRALSGPPFTVFNSTIDADQNGINVDPLPAGQFTNTRTFANGETLTFNADNGGGINGARAPGFFSIDLRLAYKYRFTERINGGFTFEIFNLTNRTNYDETTVSGDVSRTTVLIPSVAKPGRTIQLGFRVAF